MTDQEILKKSIEKAVINGFDDPRLLLKSYEDCANFLLEGFIENVLIFNHDFAKAFWGEEICVEYCPCNLEYRVAKFTYEYNEDYSNNIKRNYGIPIKMWEYHLQQIVLEEEPLKYLEKFL